MGCKGGVERFRKTIDSGTKKIWIKIKIQTHTKFLNLSRYLIKYFFDIREGWVKGNVIFVGENLEIQLRET